MARHRSLMDIDLEDQVEALRKQLGVLQKVVARRGNDFYDDASETMSDTLSDIGSRISSSLPAIRRRAKVVERVAFDHPAVVATVGLVLVGLVASLLIGRRSSSPPPAPARRNAGPRRRQGRGASARG
jgi:hypothetical protein